MAKWYTELHTPHTGITFKQEKLIYSGRTKFQKMDIIENETFGKVLFLDGYVMLTDKDEFHYHEMMSHMSLFTHNNPRTALVIGGGDGGVIREMCKHPYIERIDQSEIDDQVIEKSKKFFPQISAGYKDPRVNVHIEDGFKFLRKHPKDYDVISIDSTDPIGPGKVLFSLPFYRRVLQALTEDGIMTAQIGSPFFNPNHVRRTFRKLRKIFPIVRPYMVHVPTYMDGYYCLAFCSKKYDPLETFDRKRFDKLNLDLKYFNPELQRGCLMLPTYVANLMQD
jgi:spermidine synthase